MFLPARIPGLLQRVRLAHKALRGELLDCCLQKCPLPVTRKELQRARRSFHGEHAVLEEILASMPTAVVVTGTTEEQSIKKVNPAFLRLFGYETQKDVVGRPMSIVRPPNTAHGQLMDRIYEQTIQGEEWNGRVIVMDSKGSTLPVQLHTAAIYGRDGTTPTSLVATMVALRKIEERERLATMGALAAGAAHDINNCLTAILGYAELLTGLSEREDGYLQTIVAAGTRASRITRGLLSFRPGCEQEEIQLNDVIRDYTTKELQEQMINGYNVRVEVNYGSERIVYVDPSLVTRLVDNLLRNAAHAQNDADSTSRVFLRTRDCKLDDYVTLHDSRIEHLKGDYVTLEVQDEGPGIPEDVLSKIFNPFFTTRKGKKGTGLGLGIVQDVVRKHEGCYMTVDSVVGEGTKFTVYFPAMNQ